MGLHCRFWGTNKPPVSKHSNPLRTIQWCWLLCPWPQLLVYSGHGCQWGDMTRVEWNNLNSIEWSGGEGSRSLFHHRPPIPSTHTLAQTPSQPVWWAPDMPPAHCLHAWVQRGCVDTAGVGRSAVKSSDLTGVKAPLSRSFLLSLSLSHPHTHKHTHTHSQCISIHSVFTVFLWSDLLKFLLRHVLAVAPCFSFA